MSVRAITDKLLAVIAVAGIVVTNVALVTRLAGYIGFDSAMQTAIVSGIVATIAGALYLTECLHSVEKRHS